MPRPARPYWRGQLRLSLVSLAVELYNAVETSSQISFRMIHRPSGKRVQYRKAVPDIGEVPAEDIVKGYEIARDQYVLLEPDEVEAVRLESKHVLDLVQFVDMAEIDPRYFERPYYLLPADDTAAEGYVVIREALERGGKAGLGQLVVGGREHLVAVAPVGRGLVMEILRYGSEVKPAADFFDSVPEIDIDPEMVEIATQIVERKAATFDPHAFQPTATPPPCATWWRKRPRAGRSKPPPGRPRPPRSWTSCRPSSAASKSPPPPPAAGPDRAPRANARRDEGRARAIPPVESCSATILGSPAPWRDPS
jgi:DNA end-binding protein Ku